MKGLSI